MGVDPGHPSHLHDREVDPDHPSGLDYREADLGHPSHLHDREVDPDHPSHLASLNISLQLLPFSGLLHRVTHETRNNRANNGYSLTPLLYKEKTLYVYIVSRYL